MKYLFLILPLLTGCQAMTSKQVVSVGDKTMTIRDKTTTIYDHNGRELNTVATWCVYSIQASSSPFDIQDILTRCRHAN